MSGPDDLSDRVQADCPSEQVRAKVVLQAIDHSVTGSMTAQSPLIKSISEKITEKSPIIGKS